MGIQINGQTDTVSSTTSGGKVTVTSASFPSVDNLNVSGIITTTSLRVGTGVTISSGIITANTFSGSTFVGVFPVGTLMLFQQTSAPTGWTKQTTHNDKTLRVVSGAASSGGSTAFTSVFTSRTPSGTVSVSGSNSGGSVSNTTLTTTQIPSHDHSTHGQGVISGQYYIVRSSGRTYSGGGGDSFGGNTSVDTGMRTSFDGGSSSHNHGFTNPSWSGSASFTGSAMDFAVQYVDLIIASKD